MRADSLVRNSLLIMATTVVSSLLGFAYWAVAARLFPESAVGLAGGLVSAMALVSLVASMGLHSGLTQELPGSDDRRWSMLLTGSMLAGGTFGAVGGLAWLAFPLLSPRLAIGGYVALAVFVAGAAVSTVSFLLDYTFVAERAAQHMLFRNAAFGALKVVALVAGAVVVGRTAMALFAPWVAVQVVVFAGSVVLSLPRLRRGRRPVLRGAVSELRRLARSLAGHHLITIGALLPMYLLPLEVVSRLSTTANAWFYVTWMLGGVFMMVSPAVSSSLFAEGSHRPTEIHRAASRSARTIAVLLIPVAAAYCFAGRVVLDVFGPTYADHGFVLLLILVASAVPDAVTNVAVSVLRVERRLTEAAVLNVGMAVLAVGLAWVLLPPMGIVGAGIAWLVAQTAGTLVVAVGSFYGRFRIA